jgi:hypothetical protein
MNQNKHTVLVTACGCPGGPSVVRALAGDFRVVATDLDPAASGRFWTDAFHTVPGGDNPDFIPALLSICRREGVDVLLPESSAEVLPIARARDQFEELGVKVLVSRPEAIEVALDKAHTYGAMEGAGVPLPEHTTIPDTPDGRMAWHWMVEAIYALGYPLMPVVVKRPVGKGGRGFWIVQSELCRLDLGRLDLDLRRWPNSRRITMDELTTWAIRHLAAGDSLGRWLIMEYLQGDESSADTFDCFGSALGFTKIRRDCRNGVHFRHEASYDPQLMDWGRRTVSRLGLDYFVNVQFMAGKLLEVNPRISTQIQAPGFNLPTLGVKLALGLIDRAEVALPDGVRAEYFLDLRSYEEDNHNED